MQFVLVKNSQLNYTMNISNWEIGCEIVEVEQKGQDKAQYGKYIIKNLAERLTAECGEGYNEANLDISDCFTRHSRFISHCVTNLILPKIGTGSERKWLFR